MEAKIYGLIGTAMRKIGAIGKDSTNAQQGFKYRGIDAVYNALSPVMSELGLFICPEVLEQTREERTTKNGSVLTYTILKMKYTMYAPDGSNVSCTVIGEGMDSGDKSSNKAMSVAMKYAAFQMFMIPTEELVDPDAEVHTDVMPKKRPEASAKRAETPVKQDAPAQVNKVSSAPQTAQNAPKKGENPVLDYLANEREELRKARGIDKAENNAIWKKQIAAMTKEGIIQNKGLAEMTMQEAHELVNYMYTLFDPQGTELKNADGKTA